VASSTSWTLIETRLKRSLVDRCTMSSIWSEIARLSPAVTLSRVEGCGGINFIKASISLQTDSTTSSLSKRQPLTVIPSPVFGHPHLCGARAIVERSFGDFDVQTSQGRIYSRILLHLASDIYRSVRETRKTS